LARKWEGSCPDPFARELEGSMLVDWLWVLCCPAS